MEKYVTIEGIALAVSLVLWMMQTGARLMRAQVEAELRMEVSGGQLRGPERKREEARGRERIELL